MSSRSLTVYAECFHEKQINNQFILNDDKWKQKANVSIKRWKRTKGTKPAFYLIEIKDMRYVTPVHVHTQSDSLIYSDRKWEEKKMWWRKREKFTFHTWTLAIKRIQLNSIHNDKWTTSWSSKFKLTKQS